MAIFQEYLSKVRLLLKLSFPNKSIASLDGQTPPSIQSHIVRSFSAHQIDILVSTPHKMKRLPMRQAALVAIPDMDRWLQIPNFRTEALCYQWLAYLTSNRQRGQESEVWLQTSQHIRGLLHEMVARITMQDHISHYEHLLQERATYDYPPYQKLLKITLQHPEAKVAHTIAQRVAIALEQALARKIEGPFPIRYVDSKKVAVCLLFKYSAEESLAIKRMTSDLLDRLQQQAFWHYQTALFFSVDAL